MILFVNNIFLEDDNMEFLNRIISAIKYINRFCNAAKLKNWGYKWHMIIWDLLEQPGFKAAWQDDTNKW